MQTKQATVLVDQPAPFPDAEFVSFLGLAVGPNGALYTSDFANGIRSYDFNGTPLQEISTNYTGTSPSNNYLGSLAFSPKGNLFTVGFDFTAGDRGAVLRYNGLTGAPLPSAGNSGAIFVAPTDKLLRPIGITYAPIAVPEPGTIAGLFGLGIWSVLAGRKSLRRQNSEQL